MGQSVSNNNGKGRGMSRSMSMSISRRSDEEGIEDYSQRVPDECLASVFGKLGWQEREACSRVCTRWKSIESKTRLRLVLDARPQLSPVLPSLLARFDAVTVLSLKSSRRIGSINDHSLCLIAKALTHTLKKLKLKACIDITDDGLHAFSLICASKHAALTKLSIASCHFGPTGLNSLLSNCSRLQDLTLKRLKHFESQNIPLGFHNAKAVEDDDDEDMELRSSSSSIQNRRDPIMIHSNLERLCLKDLHNAPLFAPLIRCCSKLKTLIVCRSQGNWDQVLQSSLHSNVTEIQMENLQLGDPGLIAISSACAELQVLYLGRTSDCTDSGFSAIANSCRKLRKLHIDACSKFGNRTVGEECVVSLATKCYRLQEMVLMGIPVTIYSLNALASNCPALERMALCNTDSVGDLEMGFIAAKFLSLKKLCVKNCPVSDAGIDAIAIGCPNLVKLKVKKCRGVTQASVSRLRMQRKSLVVSVDAGSLPYPGEDIGVEEDEAAIAGGGGGGGRRTIASSNSRVDIVCGALRSRLGTATLVRRHSMPSSSSAHVGRR